MSTPHAVIMAGGSGERFWPLSRLKCPKQLLPIVGDQPMLTQTLERLAPAVPIDNIWVITHACQQSAVLKTCPQLLPEQVIGEPLGCNTAATVALAAVLIKQRDPDAVFAVLPADQVIRDTAAFQKALSAAFDTARDTSALITFGILPTHPATGYGYIQRGAPLEGAASSEAPIYTVERFVEKPDAATAQTYFDSRQYYWNAGQFIWRVQAISEAFARYAPALWKGILEIDQGLAEGTPLDALMEQIYPGLEKISIDYAVMEKADTVLVIESTFDWDDVGEWPAIARHEPADSGGNNIQGQALVYEGKDNIVIGSSDHLVSLIGVDDLVVVHTPDATLVCPKSKSQAIKELVKKIAENPDWQHTL